MNKLNKLSAFLFISCFLTASAFSTTFWVQPPKRKIIFGRDSFLVIEPQPSGRLILIRVYPHTGKLFQKMNNMKSGLDRANFGNWIENIKTDLSGFPPLWSFSRPFDKSSFPEYYVFDGGNVVVALASNEQSMESFPNVVGVEFRNSKGVLNQYLVKELCPRPVNYWFSWLGPIGKSRFWYFESDLFETSPSNGQFSISTTDWYSYSFKIADGRMIRKSFLLGNIKFKFLLWFPLFFVFLAVNLFIRFPVRTIVSNKYFRITLLALVHLLLSISLSDNFLIYRFHELFHDFKSFSYLIVSWPLIFHLRNWPPFFRFLQMSLGFVPFVVNSLIWGLMIYWLFDRYIKQRPNLALHRTPTAGAGEL